LSDLKLELSRQSFVKSYTKFHENPASGTQVVPRGRKGRRESNSQFRNFVIAPKRACRKTQLHWSPLLSITNIPMNTESRGSVRSTATSYSGGYELESTLA